MATSLYTRPSIWAHCLCPDLASSLHSFSSVCFSHILPRQQQCPLLLLRVRAAASSASSPSVPSSMYAKEMERIAAKEALLLAIADGGGDNALIALNKSARIDVNEKIVSLERLNPTPRPTTSPLLEGLWQFKWIGSGSPGEMAARVLLQSIPNALAMLSELRLLILDGSAKATITLKVLNTIVTSIVLTSKLTVEGPSRLKEEYLEGLLSSPNIEEGALPMQMRSAYDQAVNALQRLPDTMKESLSSGVKFPLTGTFERQLLISYLDEEILVVRDETGSPEVLSRVNSNIPGSVEPVSEYVS